MFVIGLMSGTSIDGIDAALVEFGGHGLQTRYRLLGMASRVYPPSVRRRLIRLAEGEPAPVAEVARLDYLLGELFAEAARAAARSARVAMRRVDLIGSHGQTICHLPRPRREAGRVVRATLQIGESSIIAARTGVPTVSCFRAGDIAVGGEGAPLTPVFHAVLLGDRRTQALLNIGGIANVTVVHKGKGLRGVAAFDTGPGNMLVDGAVVRLTNGRRRFDAGGRMALRGSVHRRLLDRLCAHPYFGRMSPKSAGREEFGRVFLDGAFRFARRCRIAPEDLVATLSTLTAWSAADGLRSVLSSREVLSSLYLSGGGARNRYFLEALRSEFPSAEVKPVEALGLPAKAVEPIAFAYFAYERVARRSVNLPRATGARRTVPLGKVSLPPGRR